MDKIILFEIVPLLTHCEFRDMRERKGKKSVFVNCAITIIVTAISKLNSKVKVRAV